MRVLSPLQLLKSCLPWVSNSCLLCGNWCNSLCPAALLSSVSTQGHSEPFPLAASLVFCYVFLQLHEVELWASLFSDVGQKHRIQEDTSGLGTDGSISECFGRINER